MLLIVQAEVVRIQPRTLPQGEPSGETNKFIFLILFVAGNTNGHIERGVVQFVYAIKGALFSL